MSIFRGDERLRYSRQMMLPAVGEAGQARLRDARVLLVGAGGLGSPGALYLAAAGVGNLGIVDFDTVVLSNLHRQVIHGTSDVGHSKLESAAATLYEVNPNVRVTRHEVRLTRGNAREILGPYDLVVDGTDNFPTRYLINDACVLLGKTNVYGSILGFEGQATVFASPDGPCYRCLFPEPPPPGAVLNCADGGVLGVLPGVIGMIQATEAIKLILGIGDSLVGRLLMFDALNMRFREVRIRRDPGCPACGDHPTITDLADYEALCSVGPSLAVGEDQIEPIELARLRADGKSIRLIDVRTPEEYASSRIPGGVLIPLAELPFRIGELDRDEITVLYCHSGNRSERARKLLAAAGFRTAINLVGGIVRWEAEGGEIEE